MDPVRRPGRRGALLGRRAVVTAPPGAGVEPVKCDGCDAHERLWQVEGGLLCKDCLYDDEGIAVDDDGP